MDQEVTRIKGHPCMWRVARLCAALLLGVTASEIIVTAPNSEAPLGVSESFHPTIDQAQHHVRGLRAAGVSGDIVLDIGEGTYRPFSIGVNDSGAHANDRTVYRGRGAKTRISGGTEIPPALFKPSKAFPALLTADISSLKIDPASFGEISAVECIHTCATTRAMLSFNDEEMTLARWPNFDRANGRNVYVHLASGNPGSFVVSPDNETVKARMLGWGKQEGGWLHGYWEWDWADCYRKIENVVPSVAMWEVHITGQQFSPTIGVNGTKDDLFRVRTVSAGGPDDPLNGTCKQYQVDSQNILEQTHDHNKTWVLAAPLNCGNQWQKVGSADFIPAGTDVKFTFSPADTAPKKNARFYATNLLSELDQPGEFYFEITKSTMKVHMIPPPGYSTDPTKWVNGPVVGLKTPVVDMSGS